MLGLRLDTVLRLPFRGNTALRDLNCTATISGLLRLAKDDLVQVDQSIYLDGIYVHPWMELYTTLQKEVSS